MSQQLDTRFELTTAAPRERSSDPSSRREAAFAAAAIGAAYLGMVIYTWRKWPDVVIDFGLQLYCPWKISTGTVLYRDLAYLDGGPFSQYFDALLFKLFGVSFMTYAMANIILTALLLVVIYRSFYRVSDQLTAVTACLAIIMLFAFAQFDHGGLFNYITPYCTEIFHGLVLSVLAVMIWAQWFCREKVCLAAWAGLLCGLTFLTKPEVFLAHAILVVAALVLFAVVKKNNVFLVRSMAALVGGLAAPVLGFFIYFWRMIDFTGAWRAVCAGWIPVLTTNTADNPYFRWGLGMDNPPACLRNMLVQSAGLAVIVAAGAFVCRRAWQKSFPVLVPLVTLELATLSWFHYWKLCGQCLPVVCLALLGILLWRAKKSGWNARLVFPFLWTIFALGMLIKLGFNTRIYHYGFVLGMPAFLSAIYFLLWLLPAELDRFNVEPQLLRFMLWVPLMIGMGSLFQLGLIPYPLRKAAMGTGTDKIWVHDGYRPEDSALIKTMNWLETNTPPQSTLAVLPANLMVNYLMRRTNPSRYPIWPPPEVTAFGQEKMTEDFINHSPDYIVLLRMHYDDFGVKPFGVEKKWGGDVMTWINAHYRERLMMGEDWTKTKRFGLKILQKSSAD